MSSEDGADVQVTGCLSHDVVDRFPCLRIALLVAPNRQYEDSVGASEAARRVFDHVVGIHQSPEALQAAAADQPYRAFYQSMGLKAAQVSNPAKQAARVMRNGAYRAVSPLVDIAMEVEYTTLVSFQLYGLARKLQLNYVIASGSEAIVTSRDEDKTCKPGELILRSTEGVLHSCYYGNHREHMLRSGDSHALVRVMGVPGISDDAFTGAVNEAIARMGVSGAMRLDAAGPTGVLTSRVVVAEG